MPDETGGQSSRPSPFVFDADRACGANSLFLLNVMLGGSHTYSDCLALVPPRDTGNTMLEIHQAMNSMGWAVSALNASPAYLRRAHALTLLWSPPSGEVRTTDGRRYRLGHFLVGQPLSDGRWRLHDFPSKDPEIVEIDRWAAEYLAGHEMTRLPIIEVYGTIEKIYGTAERKHEVGKREGLPGLDPDDAEADEAFAAPVPKRKPPSLTPDDDDQGIDDWIEFDLRDDSPPVMQGVLNFGTALENKKLTGIVSVRNTTSRRFTVGDLQSTCGCTLGTVESLDLPPDEVVDVEVRMDLHGRIGHQVQSVTIELSDESKRKHAFVVQVLAEATRLWEVEPPSFNFGELRADATPVELTCAVSTQFAPFTPSLVRTSSSPTGTTADIQSTGEGAYEVSVKLLPGSREAGTIAGHISIHSEDDDRTALRIPLTATIVPLISFQPRNAFLNPRQGFSASISTAHIDGQPLSLSSWRSRVPGLNVRIGETRSPEGGLTLEITCDRPRDPITTGDIRLEFTLGESGTILRATLPVTAIAN